MFMSFKNIVFYNRSNITKFCYRSTESRYQVTKSTWIANFNKTHATTASMDCLSGYPTSFGIWSPSTKLYMFF